MNTMRRIPALAMSLILLAGAAAAQDEERAQKYQACLELAQTNPEKARENAAQWEALGGGSQARHCAAIALIGIGAERRAATLLTEIGAQAEDLSPEDRASALTLAGDLWMRQNRSLLAVQSYERAQLLAEPTTGTRIGLARAYAAQDNFKAALGELNAALKGDALNIEALTLRAAAKRATGDNEGALLDAKRATDLEPGSPLSWFERGAAERALGHAASAQTSWTNCSILDPIGPVGDMARANLQKMILAE